MDALRRSDLELARTTPPGVKFLQAMELMDEGLALQRRKLQARDPEASAAVIEERLVAWMSEPR